MNKNPLDPNELKTLEQLRDELKLQAHLFKAEMKKEWEKLEKDMAKLRTDMAPVTKAAKESADDIAGASRLLFKTVRKGYERIKQSLAA